MPDTPATLKGPTKFCRDCGATILERAEICPACGCRQLPAPSAIPAALSGFTSQTKKRSTAIGFALLLGGIGAHKFYLGQPIQGAIYALFVWTFIPSVLGLIEGLNMLCMSDDTFQKRLGTRKL